MATSRSLCFIQVFLQSICDGERDQNHPNFIHISATKAYEMALMKYGWIVQIFHAAMYVAPYKSDFPEALSTGQNVTEEECLEKIASSWSTTVPSSTRCIPIPNSTTRCRCAQCGHDQVTRPPTCSHLQKQANLNHCESSG